MYACGSPTQISYDNSSESPVISSGSVRHMLLRSIRRKSSLAAQSASTSLSTPNRKHQATNRSIPNTPDSAHVGSSFPNAVQINVTSNRLSPLSAASHVPSGGCSVGRIPRAFSVQSISDRFASQLNNNSNQATSFDVNIRIWPNTSLLEADLVTQAPSHRRLTLTQELLAGGERSYVRNSLFSTSKRNSLDFSRIHSNPLDPLNCLNKPRARSESTLPIIQQYVQDRFFEPQWFCCALKSDVAHFLLDSQTNVQHPQNNMSARLNKTQTTLMKI